MASTTTAKRRRRWPGSRWGHRRRRPEGGLPGCGWRDRARYRVRAQAARGRRRRRVTAKRLISGASVSKAQGQRRLRWGSGMLHASTIGGYVLEEVLAKLLGTMRT